MARAFAGWRTRAAASGLSGDHLDGQEVKDQCFARYGGCGDHHVAVQVELVDGEGLVVPQGIVRVDQGYGHVLDVVQQG